MLKFKTITQRDMTKLRRYYDNCSYRLCEYSVGVRMMWREALHPTYTETEGCLITTNTLNGKLCFDYPVPGEAGDVEAALERIEEYCAERDMPLIFTVVPEEELGTLIARYPCCRVTKRRMWCDYLYRAEDMREFAGRRYSGQRNHINKFRKLYPGAKFCMLHAGDEERIERFFAEYEQIFTKQSGSAKRELRLARQMFSYLNKPYFCVGGMELDGRLISVALGERCGETMIVHIEKALYGYEGVYPAMVNEFAKQFGGDVRFFNREDDAGDRGLRTSKLQYLPTELAGKCTVEVENELAQLREIHEIKTQRLTLSALTDADRAAYNAICLDDERNKWWGYDYRKDYHGESIGEYFLGVARSDFANRLAVNFAVRLDGKCIGEAILYHFDGKGGAELGCRIAREYAGSGYGTEAFAAAAEWGLYGLGLGRVWAKCFRENEASYKMLSACMRRSGEDETYYYFNKEV